MGIIHELKHFIDPNTLIQFGYFAIAAIIFAESGLLVGFFLPGDSLLLLAGVAAAAGKFNIATLVILVFLAAFAGDQLGYLLGNRYGRKLFERKESRFFKKEYVKQSEAFFAKHGHKTIILARFVPIVRTFTPVLAGVGSMTYGTYLTYDLVGSLLWGVGVTLIGYFLGTSIPNLNHYLNYIVIGIIVLSVLPVILHLFGARKIGSRRP